jgi:hypothetical protein
VVCQVFLAAMLYLIVTFLSICNVLKPKSVTCLEPSHVLQSFPGLFLFCCIVSVRFFFHNHSLNINSGILI